MKKYLYLLFFVLVGCKVYPPISSDIHATNATNKLYDQLRNHANKGLLIGYQEALAYGIGWNNEGVENCDMYRTSGEYPAIYGWDLGDIHRNRNIDDVSFEDMQEWIVQVHRSGGINTVSWHMDNPVNGNNSWDTTKIGSVILPGGSHHGLFLEKLDQAATFFKGCKSDNDFVPIIFRPYHEHNGNWFWWGKGNFTEEEFIAVWKFTADYFRKFHDIHHLIYTFSPDRSRMKNPSDRDEYLYAYPGDEYVDIIGLDDYWDVGVSDNDSLNIVGANNLMLSIEMITDIASDKGKIAALSETGNDGIKDAEWFSNRILGPILSSTKAQRIAYVMMWRNHSKTHHYIPYPGHPAASDFQLFINHPFTLTLNDIGKKKQLKMTKR